MYDTMWPKAKRPAGRQKAIIAARFEECQQDFNRLCARLDRHFPDTKAKSLSDCLGSFVAWGSETGANDQTLDYKLRKANDMQEMVVELLTQLHEVIEEGKLAQHDQHLPSLWNAYQRE